MFNLLGGLMYNWAMLVWNMSADVFVWSFIKWAVVLYCVRFIYREINMRQMRRFARLR